MRAKMKGQCIVVIRAVGGGGVEKWLPQELFGCGDPLGHRFVCARKKYGFRCDVFAKPPALPACRLFCYSASLTGCHLIVTAPHHRLLCPPAEQPFWTKQADVEDENPRPWGHRGCSRTSSGGVMCSSVPLMNNRVQHNRQAPKATDFNCDIKAPLISQCSSS